MISPYTAVTETETYERVNARWQATFHEPLGFYDANIYDGCWVLALSALEVDSDNGTAVREVIHEVAGNYTGASGRCLLNQYGDRMAVDYALWGYFEVDGTCENLRCGTYHHESDDVEWRARAGYFISGIPMIINEVCIHRILDVHVYPEALQRLVPYRIAADLTRGMAREIFGALQIPYVTYLIPYTFLIEPIFVELPRLLIYLLLLRARP